MPDLGNACATFQRRIDESERLVSSVEALWQTAPLRSDIRRQIGETQLCALYEMAYLSIFGYWENFIEECLTRMLAGQGCASYAPIILASPKPASLRGWRGFSCSAVSPFGSGMILCALLRGSLLSSPAPRSRLCFSAPKRRSNSMRLSGTPSPTSPKTGMPRFALHQPISRVSLADHQEFFSEPKITAIP